jgi:hypothetical protein
MYDRKEEGIGAVDDGYQLKRPCKNCPFSPLPTRIVFACRERAEEIAESAYRQGFPCHLSAVEREISDDETGFVFGAKTQHCAGAIMMFLSDSNDEWPGIDNDSDLGERLRAHMDWKAPHFETEVDFIEANTKPVRKRARRG